MKLLKSFLALFIFAICASFNVNADSPPKTVSLKPLTEKISPKQITENQPPNFVRTDSLVFYEDNFTLQNGSIVFKQNFVLRNYAVSKYFRTKPIGKRLTEFISS